MVGTMKDQNDIIEEWELRFMANNHRLPTPQEMNGFLKVKGIKPTIYYWKMRIGFRKKNGRDLAESTAKDLKYREWVQRETFKYQD